MELGWSIVLETTGGPVGMWTCWLEDGFKIFYGICGGYEKWILR